MTDAVENLRLLLVEDDPGDQVIVRESLHGSGVGITAVTRLRDALDALSQTPFHVVMLDLGLPDSDGPGGVARLAERFPDVPVVVLTGRDDDDAAAAALQEGAQDYVVKGSTPAQRLDRVVRNAIERKRLQDQLGRTLRRQSALIDLGRLALEGSSLDGLAVPVGQAVARALQVDVVGLVVRGDLGYRVLGGHGWSDGQVPFDLPEDALPLADEALEAGESRVCADVAGALGADSPLARLGFGSAIAAVIPGGERAVGALAVFDRQPRTFRPSEVDFVEAMARAVGEAHRRTMAEDALRERIKEQTAVAAVARLVQRHPHGGALVREAAAALLPAMQYPELAGVEVHVDDDVAAVGVDDPAVELRVPIRVGDRLRGRIRVGYAADRPFLDEERSMLHTVAESLGTWVAAEDGEQARRASEDQLRALLEQQPGSVWTTDRDLVITSVVGTRTTSGGIDGADVVGQSILDVSARDERAAPVEEAHRLALSGGNASYSWVRDGRTWHAQVGPLRDAEGEIVGVIGGATDVSDRVEVDRQLEESRQRLQGLFDHALEAIFLFDDDRRYVDANPAALRLVGLPREEVVGCRLGELTDLGDTDLPATMYARMRRDGQAQVQQRLLRADGNVVVVELNAVADIVPGLHLLTARDVTDERAAKAALRSSEERFRSLVEHASDVVAILDADANIRFISPPVERIAAFRPEELVGRHVSEVLPDVDARALAEHWPLVLGSTEPLGPYVHRARHRDGGWRYVEVVHTNRLADPAIGGVIVNLRDVTERVRTEEALRESEERFRRLAENAPDVIYRLALRPEPRLEYLSPAVEALTGYPAEHFSTDAEAARPLLLDGAAIVAGDDGTPVTTRLRIRHRDGSIRHVERRAVVVRDREGDPVAIEAIARDVTETHQAEQALRTSEARLGHVLATMSEGLLMFDRSGRVTYVNDAAERLFEAPRDALVGRRYDDPAWALEDPDGAPLPPEQRAVQRVLVTREPLHGLLVSRVGTDGTRIVWETNAAPLVDASGELGGVVVSLREVTERLQVDRALRAALEREREAAEHLRQVDQMKTGFLQAVSHELRTPLTGVLGFSVLLQRHAELPEEQLTRLLARLEANARKLDRLLGDLLDVDRLSRGTLEARRAPTDLEDLLERTIADLDAAAGRVRLLESRVTAALDGPRTERIIENLVLNALRHTDGEVQVRAEAVDDGVLLTVADRGPGVPDDQKAVVFEPFRQGDTPASRVGGAGIGLTVVRTFAELHGGRAWVEDRPGGGALFRVLLPAEVTSATPVAATVHPRPTA